MAAKKTKSNSKAKVAAADDNKPKVAAASKPKCRTKSKSKRLLYWEEPEQLALITGWSRRGLTMEEIAEKMDIKRSTLYEWMKLSSDISDTIKKGKDRADAAVENALFTAALNGNVTAMIYYLKTRMPEYWSEKVEHKVEAEVEQTSRLAYIAPRLEE